MVKEMISDGTGNAVELEGEADADTLEVSISYTLCSNDISFYLSVALLITCMFIFVCHSMSMTPMRRGTGWCWDGAPMEWCMQDETSATRSESPSKRSLKETAGVELCMNTHVLRIWVEAEAGPQLAPTAYLLSTRKCICPICLFSKLAEHFNTLWNHI